MSQNQIPNKQLVNVDEHLVSAYSAFVLIVGVSIVINLNFSEITSQFQKAIKFIE